MWERIFSKKRKCNIFCGTNYKGKCDIYYETEGVVFNCLNFSYLEISLILVNGPNWYSYIFVEGGESFFYFEKFPHSWVVSIYSNFYLFIILLSLTLFSQLYSLFTLFSLPFLSFLLFFIYLFNTLNIPLLNFVPNFFVSTMRKRREYFVS